MKELAGRRPPQETGARARLPLPGVGSLALALIAFAGFGFGLLPPAAAQGQAVSKAPPKARAVATPGSRSQAPGRRPAPKAAAPKAPVAAKNVAVGAAAVAAAPTALLAHGCLDTTHGRWLSDELGSAAAEFPVPGVLPEVPAAAPELPVGIDGGPPEATLSLRTSDVTLAPGSPCVPFASVRTPNWRIESLALVPAAADPQGGDQPRAMVVSRKEPGASAVTSWHDLAELPAHGPQARQEVWVSLAGLLAGEAGEVPARWQREVSLLARQMKRQPDTDRAAWVRLVMSGEGESARPAAVEMVDERGAAIDSAIWVDRNELPGGFVSALGGDYERMLWQSPVDYRRISRGVGSATVIVRKRVFAPPKTPGGKPRLVVRSFRSRGQHLGIDFVAPTGTPVVAVSEGTVVHAGTNGGYGNLVVVDHGGGITTYYAHLSGYGVGVQEGARVERGQEIGLVGSTGMSTGPHLHFEIRKEGKYLDPADPKQALPNWSLASQDHEAVLTRLLALSLSRPEEFAKATRTSVLAAAQGASAAAAE